MMVIIQYIDEYLYNIRMEGKMNMSVKWYPVIDYVSCMECGICTNKCTHDVYDKEKSPTPIVVNPEGCIDGCHGCGSLCPNSAISYVGEATGNNLSCSSSCSNS